jgi:hypothetical protein
MLITNYLNDWISTAVCSPLNTYMCPVCPTNTYLTVCMYLLTYKLHMKSLSLRFDFIWFSHRRDLINYVLLNHLQKLNCNQWYTPFQKMNNLVFAKGYVIRISPTTAASYSSRKSPSYFLSTSYHTAGQQGDQMCLWQNRPKWRQTQFLSWFIHMYLHFTMEKNFWVHCAIFEKK